MDRRRFLAATGATLAVAGCSALNDGGGSSGNEQNSPQNDSPDDADPEPQPSFQASVDVPAEATAGLPLSVEITVSNEGDAAGTFESDVSYHVDNGDWQSLGTTPTMELDAGDSETTQFEDITIDTAGEVTIRVDATGATDTISVDDPPIFELSLYAPETVPAGQSFTISVEAENVGDQPGTVDTALQLEAGAGWETIQTITVDLAASEQKTVDIEREAPLETGVQDYRIRNWFTFSVEATPYGEEYVQENATTPSYEEFFRSFEEYQTTPVQFETGEIFQVQYGNQFDFLFMTVTNGDSSGTIAADWYGDYRFLEGDQIKLWGIAEELYSYETVQGDRNTVPRVTLVEYETTEE